MSPILAVNGRLVHFANYRSMVTSRSIMADVLATRHPRTDELHCLSFRLCLWLKMLFHWVNLFMGRAYVTGSKWSVRLRMEWLRKRPLFFLHLFPTPVTQSQKS